MCNVAAYTQYYTMQLEQTEAHSKATNFSDRATARELLDIAQLKLARMHKGKRFCLETALAVISEVKAARVEAVRLS
jgi:hypothetical protein